MTECRLETQVIVLLACDIWRSAMWQDMFAAKRIWKRTQYANQSLGCMLCTEDRKRCNLALKWEFGDQCNSGHTLDVKVPPAKKQCIANIAKAG